MSEPNLVTQDEIRAVNGYFSRALRDQLPAGAELKVGEKMVKRGLWKLWKVGEQTPSEV